MNSLAGERKNWRGLGNKGIEAAEEERRNKNKPKMFVWGVVCLLLSHDYVPSQLLGLKTDKPLSVGTCKCPFYHVAQLSCPRKVICNCRLRQTMCLDVFYLSGNNRNSEFKFGETSNTTFCVFFSFFLSFCRWQDFYSISNMSSTSWRLIQLQSHLHCWENKWNLREFQTELKQTVVLIYFYSGCL